jgi:hypothetical protein
VVDELHNFAPEGKIMRPTRRAPPRSDPGGHDALQGEMTLRYMRRGRAAKIATLAEDAGQEASGGRERGRWVMPARNAIPGLKKLPRVGGRDARPVLGRIASRPAHQRVQAAHQAGVASRWGAVCGGARDHCAGMRSSHRQPAGLADERAHAKAA